MSCKVLHIIDIYLPDTMEWLVDSLELTEDIIEHHIASLYYSDKPIKYQKVAKVGMPSSYPVGFLKKALSRFSQSKYNSVILDYIRLHNIEIIHFHFGHMAFRFKYLLENFDVYKIVSLYGFDYEHLPYINPKIIHFYRNAAIRGVRFVVEGTYSRELLLKYGLPNDRITIAQMFFKRSKSINLIPWSKPINLLQVATFSEKKGQLDLLEALGKSKISKQFIVNMYGEEIDRNYSRELKLLILKNKLSQVNLNKNISKNRYLDLLQQTHIAVNLSKHTSERDSEGGCPVFLKDALALSKPIFTTFHCDIPDLAIEHYNSWLISEGNIIEAANKLIEISKLSSIEYLKYSRNSYFTAKDKIDGNWTRKCFLNLYSNSAHEAGHF